ncbi:hypothetical protein CTAYLR_008508 [Chrysophaeum taylorii]|uniref:Major royal jelly protein n=1 Tax=Chrysophaeum taylorii TaxID=2483200 RepID=A0AAD7UAK2_9STRA|nr:hypothetical protein CTAYLR_008508 [Chrysophaeum taylorii]
MWLHCLALAHFAQAAPHRAWTIESWRVVDYDWEALNTTRAAAVASGVFTPSHNAVTGIKVWRDRVFVTVPRWMTGVPSTLNQVVDGALRPLPVNVSYVQSMEIDLEGRMWIVDVGRKYFHDDSVPTVNGPARLVLFDLSTDSVVDIFEFPDSVVPYNSSFLNDIALTGNETAVISDAGGDGALVVLDLAARTTFRFVDKSTSAEADVTFVIGGVDYGNQTFTTPTDGIAYNPCDDHVYYCALQGLTLFKVPRAALFSFDVDTAAASVSIAARKTSPADGMTFAANGRLFTGGITDPDDTVYFFDFGISRRDNFPIYDDSNNVLARRQWWADTFAFNDTDLFWTTNHLDQFLTSTMDFGPASSPNFEIHRANVGSPSYLHGCSL